MRVSMAIHAMGKMTLVRGKDCNEFKPERWITEERKIKRELPSKFLAFNAGVTKVLSWKRLGSHDNEGYGSNSHYNVCVLEGPNKINTGGSEDWHFGFNYTEWAFQNGPFYFNDTLVFKYDPPSNTTFPHSVYLLPNLWSFLTCDSRRAKMIANPTQGGDGFHFELNRWRPYYFACGERNGFHCKVGRNEVYGRSIFSLALLIDGDESKIDAVLLYTRFIVKKIVVGIVLHFSFETLLNELGINQSFAWDRLYSKG
ncbi:hypothetical protein REPUB_Repub01dG0182200 [Reevesia pubescens]